MNWNEYKTLAIRTESVPYNSYEKIPRTQMIGLNSDLNAEPAWIKATRLLHATMGVCTELAELIDGSGVVNFVEEVGDVLWYLAIADDVIGFHSRGNVYKNKPPIYWLGELNDVLKRHLFYGTELNEERLVMAFIHIYQDVYSELANHSFTMEMAMEANIRKLEKRFPEKMFTAQAAIHRDVDRELDHIMLNGELIPKIETLLELETDEQLAEVVNERRGQPTVTYDLDILLAAAICDKWAKLIDGVVILPYEEGFNVKQGRQALRNMIINYIGCTEDELATAVSNLNEWDVRLSLTPEEGVMMQVIHMEADIEVDPFKDAKPVNLDDLELPPHASLEAADWASVVNANLTAAQITAMAMGLCTDIAKHLRSEGANLEAKAYDALYVMMGSSNSLLADNSLFHMWDNLGYSIRKIDVLERLERWK